MPLGAAHSKVALSLYDRRPARFKRRLEKDPMKTSAIFAFACVALASPALAQESAPASLGEAIGKVFEGANLRSTPSKPADFVVRSRPASLDYMPLAEKGAVRKSDKKSAKELKHMEDDFSAAAAANRARAARAKIPDAQPGTPQQRSSAAPGGSASRRN